jgi:F-type H+-transporting ATPase subunit b
LRRPDTGGFRRFSFFRPHFLIHDQSQEREAGAASAASPSPIVWDLPSMKRVQTPRTAPDPIWHRRAVASAALALLVPSLAAAAEHGLVLVPDLRLLLALIAFFVLLIAPANALVFKPLLRVLDERDARIAGTRTKAERLEQEAAAILARYEQAVREAREEGERGRRSLLTEVRAEVQREIAAARREAEGRLESARGEIAASLDSARAALRGQAQDLASQAASQVLGRAL